MKDRPKFRTSHSKISFKVSWSDSEPGEVKASEDEEDSLEEVPAKKERKKKRRRKTRKLNRMLYRSRE